MKLEVVLAFGTHRKGDLIDPPALLAQRLLATCYLGIPLVKRVADAAPMPPPPPPRPKEPPPPPRPKRRD